MKWLAFSYSFPAKTHTTPRVRIWRNLRRMGAVSPKTGLYVLPAEADCVDALRWLAVDVEQQHGEAIIMQVEQFENISESQVTELFRQQQTHACQDIERKIVSLTKEIQDNPNPDNVVFLRKNITKLKKEIEDVSRVDFFRHGNKQTLLQKLLDLQKTLVPSMLVVLLLVHVAELNDTVLRRFRQEPPVITLDEHVLLSKSYVTTY